MKSDRKVKVSADGNDVNKELIIHVPNSSKNHVINKFSTNSLKLETWSDLTSQ